MVGFARRSVEPVAYVCPPHPLLLERALARRVSTARQPRAQAGRTGNKDRDASRCGRDDECSELGIWLTTNRYQFTGPVSGTGALNLSRTSGADC